MGTTIKLQPMGPERSMKRRGLERELQKAGERGVEVMGPGNMSEEERKVIEKMMEMDKNQGDGQSMKPKGYKKGGMISEYGGMETYKSKSAMAKHEKAESPKKEKMEGMGSGYKKGGMVTRGQGCVSRKKSCKMC